MSNYAFITGEGLIYWPDCKYQGCTNKQCKALNSEYCYPHTVTGESFYKLLEDLHNEPVRSNTKNA